MIDDYVTASSTERVVVFSVTENRDVYAENLLPYQILLGWDKWTISRSFFYLDRDRYRELHYLRLLKTKQWRSILSREAANTYASERLISKQPLS